LGFLYFIETEQFQGTVEDVARAGLSYAFERSPMVRASSQGPGGRAGFVVSGNVDLGFYPAKQSWRRNVKTSKNQNVETWVGKDNGAAIEPWELARSRTLNGHAITLLDGRRWVCPVARRLVDLPDGTLAWTNALPHKWDVDEGGRWITGAVLPRYAALWEEVSDRLDSPAHALSGGHRGIPGISQATEARLTGWLVNRRRFWLRGHWAESASGRGFPPTAGGIMIPHAEKRAPQSNI